MFENMTYETILADMLSRIPNDIDKREGSIIYDALAPSAFKLAETYFLLGGYVDLFYGDTAPGEYLDRKVADHGLQRKPATYAVRKIESDGALDIGSRWGIQGIVYVVSALLSENRYSATCEQAGAIGNAYSGILENIDNVYGVTASLTDIITAGVDQETDEQLRKKFKEYLFNPPQDGNDAQYKKWATDFSGVGRAKVFPLWNGGNTVKVAITNSLFQPAESGLVEEFQNHIDPGSQGLGNGVAPIGSKVTVTSGTRKDINISANVVLADGYSHPSGAAEAISKYLAEVTYIKNSVSYMRIGSSLLDCESITDINSLTINGGTSDIALNGDEIPVLTSLNLAVVP